jgi:prepilin-type N-terminal cleavage/methylation domain-containing protein
VLKQKKGFTLLEIVASIFILSFVFTSAISIFISVRTQAFATQERMRAVEAGTQIRNIFIQNTPYSIANLWLSTHSTSQEFVFDKDTCDQEVFNCNELFSVSVNDELYDDIQIIFTVINDYELYQVIHFKILIPYYRTRTVEMRGILYESII